MSYLYLIVCQDDSIYTGITHDLVKRIRQHKLKKGAQWTKVHGFKYYTYYTLSTFGDAMREEKRVKKLSRQAKLEIFAKHGIFY